MRAPAAVPTAQMDNVSELIVRNTKSPSTLRRKAQNPHAERPSTDRRGIQKYRTPGLRVEKRKAQKSHIGPLDTMERKVQMAHEILNHALSIRPYPTVWLPVPSLIAARRQRLNVIPLDAPTL